MLLDELWANRHQQSSREALQGLLQDSEGKFELLWRRARLRHFQAMIAVEEGGDPLSQFASAARDANLAVRLEPSRVEGHFWRGVNLIEAARRRGSIAALLMLPGVSSHIRAAAQINSGYHFAGPLRVWARLTHLRPTICGGSVVRALDIYQQALRLVPDNSTTMLYYAEALLAVGHASEAFSVLQQIVAAEPDSGWRWEQARDKERAAVTMRNHQRLNA